MARLCVTPCGSTKIWDKYPGAAQVAAREMYIGSFTKACQAYAEAFFAEWVIMSAKYGLLRPDKIVPGNYQECFLNPLPRPITLAQMQAQVASEHLDAYDGVVVVGSKRYCKIVKAVFGEGMEYSFPLLGLGGMGYMVQSIKRAIADGEEIHSVEYERRT